MSTTYARIHENEVVEIILPVTYPTDSPEDVEPGWSADDEIPVTARYTPGFVATLVDITAVNPSPDVGWIATQTAGAWTFSGPSVPATT